MTDDIKQVGERFVRTDLGGDSGERFDSDAVPTTTIPSTVLYRCPACERWTEADE